MANGLLNRQPRRGSMRRGLLAYENPADDIPMERKGLLQGLIGATEGLSYGNDAAEAINFGLRAYESPEFRQQLKQPPRGLLAGGQQFGVEQATTLEGIRALGREPVINDPQMRLLSAAMPAMVAFHGTPHKFAPERVIELPDGSKKFLSPDAPLPEGARVIDELPLGRFDSSKIGTGEGAQAYGHGLYFAENPGVGRGYRESLSGRIGPGSRRPADSAHVHAARDMLVNGMEPEEALEGLRLAYPDADVGDLKTAIHAGNPGHLLEVDIPDEAIDRMLDWDKPLSEQPESVRRAVDEALSGDTVYEAWKVNGAYENTPAANAYKRIAEQQRNIRIEQLENINARLSELNKIMDADSGVGYRNFRSDAGRQAAAEYDRLLQLKADTIPVETTTLEGSQKAASEVLNELGIPGIRYLDAGSRGLGGHKLRQNLKVRNIDQWREQVGKVLSDPADRRLSEVIFHNRHGDEDIRQLMEQITSNWPDVEGSMPGVVRPSPERMDRVIDALTEQGTRNFVVFDDTIPKIIDRK